MSYFKMPLQRKCCSTWVKSKYICYRMRKASEYFLVSPSSCHLRVVHRPAASASTSILVRGRISGPTLDLLNLDLHFNKTSRCVSNIKVRETLIDYIDLSIGKKVLLYYNK